MIVASLREIGSHAKSENIRTGRRLTIETTMQL